MEKRVTFNERWLPYLLVAPQIVITLVFFFWPTGQMIWQSVLLEDAFGGNSRFVWFDNFAHLFSDASYYASARLTLVFSALVASVGLAVSLLLVVIAAVWNQVSYNFLFFLAGLQSIPRSLIEAAAIDGAGPGRRFWDIMFPLLSPTGFFLLVINILYAFFGTFGVVDALTKGGPGQATTILVYKVYNDGFRGQDLGGSAAQSVVLMAVVILLTFVQFRFIERKVHY